MPVKLSTNILLVITSYSSPRHPQDGTVTLFLSHQKQKYLEKIKQILMMVLDLASTYLSFLLNSCDAMPYRQSFHV